MRRREFLGVVGAGVCGMAVTNAFGQVTSKRPKQPNFIFMVSDDQGWDGPFGADARCDCRFKERLLSDAQS